MKTKVCDLNIRKDCGLEKPCCSNQTVRPFMQVKLASLMKAKTACVWKVPIMDRSTRFNPITEKR